VRDEPKASVAAGVRLFAAEESEPVRLGHPLSEVAPMPRAHRDVKPDGCQRLKRRQVLDENCIGEAVVTLAREKLTAPAVEIPL
jgi:hypothetical protein